MLSSDANRIADVAARVAIVVWVGVDLLGRTVFGRTPWPESVVDYRIFYESSRHVVDTKVYPAVYPYPPSAVVLQYATAQLPFPASAALWMVLTGAAALACWWALARLLELDRRPGSLVLIVVANGASTSSFQWDLRSQNCNVVFLAALLFGMLALFRHRPRAAGFWLALSFSLKLFSVLVIPYLLWTRRRAVFVWTLVFVAVFWVALPAGVMGLEGAGRAYAGWLRQLNTAWHLGPDAAHPVLASLSGSIAGVTGDPTYRLMIATTIRLAWLAVLLAAWLRSRNRAAGPDDAFGTLSDLGALVLAPIALSPYLEPYHAVPFAIPALLLVHAAADRGQSAALRTWAAALFVAAVLVLVAWRSFDVRGLVVNVQLLIASAGAIVVARVRRVPHEVPRRVGSSEKAGPVG